MTDRETIISRIQKLRKMTEQAGATEAEAQTAIKLIAKLMAEHGLTESETQLKADAQGMITDYIILWQTNYDEWVGLPGAISVLYHTRMFYEAGNEDVLEIGEMTACTYAKFFGYPIDVAASLATLQLCATATNTESAAFRGKRGDKASFRCGMIQRLIDRIKELIAERKAQAAGPSANGALVVLKDQLVKDEYLKAHPQMGHGLQRKAFKINAGAYAAGQAAGSRVDLANRTKVPADYGPVRIGRTI